MAHHGTRDFGFVQWAVVGFMLVVGVLAILSVGPPFFVIGLVLLGVMLSRGHRWPAGIGALAGAGLVGIIIGVIGAVAGPGIWAAAGATLVALSGATFWWLRCRPLP